MREIGINLGARTDMDLPTYCAYIRELGFTRVFQCVTTPEKVLKNAEVALAAGLCYDTLHAPFKGIMNPIWQEDEEGENTLRQLTGCVDLCAEIGAPIAVVHLSAGENSPPPTDVGRGRFIRLVEYATAKGVKIAFENQRKLANLAWTFEEFKDTDAVGFCWDCGHEGCFTPGRRYMPLFGDRLICTHIHDNDGVFNSDRHLLPFDGSLDFGYVAEALRATPAVPLILELKRKDVLYESMTDEEYLVRAAEAVKRLRDMIEGEG
ncbi:MAG: sugar phosphate isomerase/epimerase [Clostridia bacterium]|nr:sugar phosphate isomerase/epimerase [Clostridia bacterium]